MKCERLVAMAVVALLAILNSCSLYGQAPNDANFSTLSGAATAAIKQANTLVNYYTGAPNISIPIYQYSHPNGLRLNMSLDYIGAGGIKVNEAPSPAGVGWFLNTGGVIARTVRGRPDDIDANGYMYAPALPADYWPNAQKYYYDTLDAEQDVFQFNINGRAGKFFIGKNKQIVTVPLSKLRIGYTAAANSPISSFYIITEDGVKYVFSDTEYERINTDFITNDFKCGYNNLNYTTAWHLSQVIAPFGTDTIGFTYNTVHQNENISYPQTAYINSSNGNLDFKYTTVANRHRYIKKIASIALPDKKSISILYSRFYKYDGRDSVIDRIKISDSVFRYGCLFKWYYGDLYTLLEGVQMYTDTAAQPGYRFSYSWPYLRAVGTEGDTLANKRDHWGYYNGANNGTNVIPSVTGIYNGANREPSVALNKASVLSQITDPSGGITYYAYEPNDMCELFTGNSIPAGGVRLKKQFYWDPITQKIDTTATYKYLTADGKSSGFLGTVPKYDYPYRRTVINGSTTTTNYTAISSDPVNNLNYTQGSTVGYSRVVVYKGSPTRNLGSEVYEFTNLQDANSNIMPATFPYAPVTQRDWAMGLPKRIATYDSSGNLVKVKRNTYDISLVAHNNSDFQSLKLGRTAITYHGDPTVSTTPRTEYYATQAYYPETGRANLVVSIDSLFHPNGSVQVTEQSMQYDTNYNLIKVTSPYNKTLGLLAEKRLYYPYHYTLTSGGIKTLKDNNIISALISQEEWIVGDANPRLLQASIMDYTQLPQGHVKPLATYALQSNAPVAQSVIGTFNPGALVRNTTWLTAQQNFLAYDSKGNLLEANNAVSGERGATIMDYGNQFPVAKVSNAPYNDIAYTSFESDGSGNWTIGSALRDYSSAITGKASYQLSNGNITRSGLTASRIYLVFVWAKTGASVSVNGTALTNAIAVQNNWHLYQAGITGVMTITISGSGLIDELRLHPREANMVTSTYHPMAGITSSADANNTISYFSYDGLNRLQVVKDKDLNILKKYEYDNNTITISTAPNWQYTGTQCQVPLNGKVERVEKDMNPFSDTYNVTRFIYDHYDCNRCQPTCGTGEKLINCQCERGRLICTSSVRTKETGVWKYKCTFQWQFSDCSLVFSYIQYNDNPCPVQGCD